MTEYELQRKSSQLLEQDPLRLHCLQAARTLELPDWYLGAGFVRNLIWDHLHHKREPTPLNDVDCVFFDPQDLSREKELALENRLRQLVPQVCWEVRNQARMHLKHADAPYRDSADAIAQWVEAPTCVGVRLLGSGKMMFTARFGLKENWSLKVRPNPLVNRPISLYRQRVRDKNWQQNWPNLTVFEMA
ncbi:nucleotidyltransferase family protein [Dongshaea marina]|uniref:nucleotidyltransferase family protein n=1 Tax=Dongshaea marina TaxID=2047966 RepID=UPI000D3E3218|nr:nucleotidyltransferase family protein [Dongshaea marina]